jgi:hypothetical protein
MDAANLIAPSLRAQAIPVQAQTQDMGTSDPRPPSAGVGIGTIGITVIGTLFIATVARQLFKKYLAAPGGLLSKLAQSPRFFSIKLTAGEVRTQDYFKLDIEAIAHFSTDAASDEPEPEILPDGLLTYSQTKVETCLRNVIATRSIEEIMAKRDDLIKDLRDSLGKSLQDNGPRFIDVSLGKIDECTNYSENNYFDARVIEKRAQRIHEAVAKGRKLDLEFQFQAKQEEIVTETKLQGLEVNLRSEQLKKEAELRKLEIDNTEELAKLEEGAERKAHDRNRDIQAVRLDAEKEILILEEQNKRAIETEKINHEIDLLRKNKDLVDARLVMQQHQAQENHKLELLELDLLITIFKKQQEKLIAESQKSKAVEAVNTAIEEEKAHSRLLTAQKAAESATVEAEAMNALTEAESRRYQLIPPNDSERMSRMVKELAPQVMDKLPELLKALAPQPGVLGESNTYTFPEGSGDSVQKLMLSTSGLLFLNTLLEGKLGLIIEQVVDQIKPLNGSK